jgi:hypothetical protein
MSQILRIVDRMPFSTFFSRESSSAMVPGPARLGPSTAALPSRARRCDPLPVVGAVGPAMAWPGQCPSMARVCAPGVVSRSRPARPACVPRRGLRSLGSVFCMTPAQQQPRRSRASPRAHLVVRRRCEVSIVCALVTLFHHVAHFK